MAKVSSTIQEIKFLSLSTTISNIYNLKSMLNLLWRFFLIIYFQGIIDLENWTSRVHLSPLMRERERENSTQVKLELHQFVSASQGLETIKTTNQHTRQRKTKTLIWRSNNISISKTNNYMHTLVWVVSSLSLPILELNLPGFSFCINKHTV